MYNRIKRLSSFTLLVNSVHRNKQFNHSVGKSKAPLEYFSLPIIHAKRGDAIIGAGMSGRLRWLESVHLV